MAHVTALAIGFLLDALLGDPPGLPHPIRAVGKLIEVLEGALRRVFPATEAGLRAAGVCLVVAVVSISCSCVITLCQLGYRVSPWLGLAVESVLCYFFLAARQLEREGAKVYQALHDHDLGAARETVSMIVGRDTQDLDEAGIARATVETVAENASDGVVAPLLFMAVGGAPAGMLYKAVNTMDSMVGYRNERYRHFGWAAARADDVLNWIPARVCGVLMCAVAPLAGLDGAGAWRIFRRDRRKHASPNSAHAEAACAGALGVQLAGPASYFGTVVDKPAIGDATHPIEPEDIRRSSSLMQITAVAALAASVILGVALYQITGGA